jgi:hypothetical protein
MGLEALQQLGYLCGWIVCNGKIHNAEAHDSIAYKVMTPDNERRGDLLKGTSIIAEISWKKCNTPWAKREEMALKRCDALGMAPVWSPGIKANYSGML